VPSRLSPVLAVTWLVLGALTATMTLGAAAAVATEPSDAALSVEPVFLQASDTEQFPPRFPTVDELPPQAVLRVRVFGFEPFAAGNARQCVLAGGQRCANSIPVQFDADGYADFSYLVSGSFLADSGPAGGCGATGPRCLVVIHDPVSGTEVRLDTVFGAVAPPPAQLAVTPSRGLTDGQVVRVEVSGLPAAGDAVAMLCAPPDVDGERRCGPPGPASPMLIGPDGHGSTNLTVRSGPVGVDRAPCGPQDPCAVSVVADGVAARISVARITFAPPAGAGYDSGRLAAGIGIAIGLLAVAVWLVAATDWSPPGEAATPDLDGAQYADLDAMVAATEPEPEEVSPGRGGLSVRRAWSSLSRSRD